MSLPPFEASRLKIRRARTHIGDLIDRIRAYLLRKPIYLKIEPGDSFPHGKKWRVFVREEVPIDLSPIIGDSVHNLRSALDLMACELVRANGKDDDGVYFPFAENAAKLPGMIKRRGMDRASVAVQGLVLATAPYRGGNVALRAIHDLDVMDKHQILIPIISMVSLAPIMGLPEIEGPSIGPIQDGAAFHLAESHAHLPIGLVADALFNLKFNPVLPTINGLKMPPLGGDEVVPTLIGLANEVERLIEAFAEIA